MHFCSRTASDVEKTQQALSSSSTSNDNAAAAAAYGTAVDVSVPDQVKRWVQSVADQHAGRIDVVVSNVSALSVPDTRASWDATYATDVMGTYTLVEAAVPFLKRTPGESGGGGGGGGGAPGCVVNISSVTGRYVDFTAPGPYGSFKAALLHYTSQLGHVLAREGVRANSVSPGNIYVEDGFWGQAEREMPGLFGAQMAANPMGRMGRPEEVADAVVWLASERASFVSGTNLLVDGAVSPGVQF